MEDQISVSNYQAVGARDIVGEYIDLNKRRLELERLQILTEDAEDMFLTQLDILWSDMDVVQRKEIEEYKW